MATAPVPSPKPTTQENAMRFVTIPAEIVAMRATLETARKALERADAEYAAARAAVPNFKHDSQQAEEMEDAWMSKTLPIDHRIEDLEIELSEWLADSAIRTARAVGHAEGLEAALEVREALRIPLQSIRWRGRIIERHDKLGAFA
jgi:hypothetical protein